MLGERENGNCGPGPMGARSEWGLLISPVFGHWIRTRIIPKHTTRKDQLQLQLQLHLVAIEVAIEAAVGQLQLAAVAVGQLQLVAVAVGPVAVGRSCSWSVAVGRSCSWSGCS